ncbi:MAG: class I adenylate-forming enzyme family protein [Burkholderiales bacterium]|jgi:acyl-CoA synthetase (AMP-forming)/AMP-acid ligase II
MHWPPERLPRLRREAHFGRVLTCFAERPAHLNALFAHTLSRHAGDEALVCADRRISYAELDRSAARVAAGFAQDGVRAGDRIAILCANEPEFVYALLAAFRLGAVAVPINVREQKPEIAYVLNQCKARALVFDAELAERISSPDAVPQLALRYAVGEPAQGSAMPGRPFAHLLEPGAQAPAPAAPDEEETAVILYTSGTTGHPKGAMLTHLNLIHSALHFQHCMQFGAGERALLAVPASHVTGLVAIILAMLRVGGCVLMLREFKARAFLELARRERMTFTLVVPAIYNLCLREPDFAGFDLSHWRVGGFGGAPMPLGTIRALAQKLPQLVLVNAYGATETTSPTTIMPLGQQAAHLDSVGAVLPCGEVRVMDDEGREVARGATGELWIAGAMVVPGYWEDAAATQREFCGGYWKSGDIGSIDAAGYVRVLDRKKDLINRGGYKVYCAEVENVLSLHPAVLESALIARPDPVLGEKAQAFVLRSDASCSAQELRAHCALHLADYKLPDFITFVEHPLPRNANGKLFKRQLRESHWQTPPAAPA